MSPLRLTGSTSGYSQIDAPAVAGDQTFTLPGTGGTLDRLNRAGNVLQVVNANYGTQTSSTSATFADTGLTATITPSNASSKILILVNQAGVYKLNDAYMYLQLLRGATKILDFERFGGLTGTTASNGIGSCSLCYLDSPSTTSAVTYKTQFARPSASGTVYVQVNDAGLPSSSTITLMEIAA